VLIYCTYIRIVFIEIDVSDMDLNTVFDNEMIEDDVIPALEMAM
jgi:hypothetical protein